MSLQELEQTKSLCVQDWVGEETKQKRFKLKLPVILLFF